MKYIYIIALFVLISTGLYGQSILVAGEYFWNNDPGFSNGSPLSIASSATSIDETYSIDIPSDISIGANTLHIRFKDENGIWGLAKIKYFISLSGVDLVDAEYYWDTDPGFGNGTMLPITDNSSPVNETHVLNVPTEFKGLRTLYVRYKDANGTWGKSKARPYNITNEIDIVEAEYYWDTDPGYGEATGLTLTAYAPEITETYDLDISSLSNGVHNLVVRVKDEFNQWSIYTAQEYIVASPIYVDHTATGANTGASWTDAYTNLNDALAASTESNPGIIHIAEGTYYPDNDTDYRSLSFDINSSTTILAGYPSGGDTEENRDPETYEVILSGDIGVENTDTDNSYHVVKTDGVSNVSVAGVTITLGYANGSGDNASGAGWLNDGQTSASNPELINCKFENNHASNWGGGMYNNGAEAGAEASPIFSDCSFDNNSAGNHGGALFNYGKNGGDSSPEFTNCTFSNNTATNQFGGAMLNHSFGGTSNPTYTNCEFFGNTGNNGGALSNYGNTKAMITNCSFANNVGTALAEHIHSQSTGGTVTNTVVNSIFDDADMDGDIFTFTSGATMNLSYSMLYGPLPTGTTDGGNNLFDTDPKYIDADNGNLKLQFTSLAIDAGDNTANAEATDLDGNDRILNSLIDMGAYEQETILPTDPFITTWEVLEEDLTVIFALGSGTYDYNIDWGDGNVDYNQTADPFHAYAEAGTYTIQITGLFPQFDFFGKTQLQEVNQWGTQEWTSMANAFVGCTNVTEQASDSPDLSLATSMDWMFSGCTSLNQDISNWDVSNITSMDHLFENCSSFNQDISSWDVGNVTNMTAMFLNATSFDQNIGSWDVESVIGMTDMFGGVTLSTSVYDNILISWNTQNLQSPVDFGGGNSMYCNGADARQSMMDNFDWYFIDGGISPTCPDSADYFITTWQTTSDNESITIPTSGSGYNYEVIWGDGTITGSHFGSDADLIISGIVDADLSGGTPKAIELYVINDIADLSAFGLGSANNGGGSDGQEFTFPAVSALAGEYIYVASEVVNFNAFFGFDPDYITGAVAVNGDDAVELFHNGEVIDLFGEIDQSGIGTSWEYTNGWVYRNDYTSCPSGNFDESEWTYSGVDVLEDETSNATAGSPFPISTFGGISCSGSGQGHTGNTTHTYADAGVYEVKISGNFPKIYFNNSGDKDKIISIDQWGSQVWGSMAGSFHGCTLIEGNAVDVPDLSLVFNASSMFEGASVFNGNIENWDVSNIGNMNKMFQNATLFNQDIGNWDVSNGPSMQSLFNGTSSFDQNLSNWNVESVTNMSNMLNGVTLSTVNYDALLIGWDAQNLQPNLNFSGGNSQYCYAESARNNMINNDGWSITDGGEQTGCDPITPQFTLSLGAYNCVSDMYDISVEVTGLGGGTTVDITNDSGGSEHIAVGLGTYEIGSFTEGSTVAITVTDTDNNPSTTTLTYDVACPCGAAFEWTGAEDNLWSNPNNWCQGGLPGVGDDVILPATAANDPNVDIEVEINSLDIYKPLTVLATGALKIIDDGNLYNANVTNFGLMEVRNFGSATGGESEFHNMSGATIILTLPDFPTSSGVSLRQETIINDGDFIINQPGGSNARGITMDQNFTFPTPAAQFINNGSLTMDGLLNDGVYLNDGAIFINNGTFDITNIGSAHALNTSTTPEEFTNNGTINIDGGNGIFCFVDTENTGTINIENASSGFGAVFTVADHVFDNSGTINIVNSSKAGLNLAGSPSVINSGSIYVENGLLPIVSATNPWTNSGSLQGQGLITGDMTNTGTLIPGQSPGIITYDDAFTNTGEIEFEVVGLGGAGAADGHDQLILNTDENTLGGTITVTSTHTATPGDQFVLISATDGYTGTFATTNLPPNESGFSWEISYEAEEVILSLGPLCYAPSDLVVTNLGENTADLSWTPGGNCALDGTYWLQSIQDPPPTVGVGGETFTCGGALPVSVTGLIAGETYNVYVYESCGTGIDVGPELVGSFATWMDCEPDGQFGLDFDGQDDHVDISTIPSSNNYSVEFWFNPQFENRQLLRSETNSSYNISQFTTGLGMAGTILPMDISINQWNHLAISNDGTGTATFYLNGAYQGEITSDLIFVDQKIGPKVGNFGNSSFKGEFDEFRVWDGPLSEADILARLNTELVGNEANLVAYYNFNDGNGNTILSDLTTNGYDGTLTNMDPNSDWVCGFEPIPCLQASGLSTTDIGGTSATANWATNGNTDFEVIIGESGFTFGNEENTYNVTGSSIEMTALEEGKTYDWYVRADCDADGYSSYTGPETFTINNTALDFSVNTGYLTHIVSPLEGLPEDLYRFEVKYTNTEGTLPTGAYPRLLIDEDGDGDNDQLVSMTEVDAADTDVTDGKIYFVELTGFQPGDDYILAVEDIKPNGFTNTLGPIDELNILQPVDVSIFAADISFSDDNPDPNTEIIVTATITNNSSFDATNFSASLYNEFSETYYPDINNIDVLSGGTTDISWTIATPNEVAFVPVRVTIDIDDILVEPNELDNDAVRPFINGPFVIGDAGINVEAELFVTEVDNISYTTVTGTATYFGLAELEDEPVAGGDVQFEVVPLGDIYNTHTNNDGEFSYTFLTPSIGYNIEGTVTDLFFIGEFEVGPCLADVISEIENVSFANEGELFSFDVTFTNNGCLGTMDPFTATVHMPDGVPTSINVAVPALESTEDYTETIEVTYNTFGDKTITADADINEEIIEFSEDNDFVRDIYVLCEGVDLRAQSVIYNTDDYPIDECGFEFDLPIRNFGVTTSAETTAKVEKMKGAALISTEYYTIPPIASLGTHLITFFDTFENDPGIYSYVVTADDSDDQVECIEDNQEATTSFDVIGCGRDLRIGYCGQENITTLDGTPGDVVTISSLIVSVGGEDILEDFDVSFVTADETIIVTHTGGLADGSSVTLTADVTIPTSGSLVYTVNVDSGEDVTELSEFNNIYHGQLSYDFSLTSFCNTDYQMFWERLYTPFEPINMEIGLRNNGNLIASEVDVHFQVIAGPGVTSPVDLGTVMVPNVKRGCACPRSVFLQNPASLSMTGTYTIRMTADSGDAYSESNEINNTKDVFVTVTSDPDFATESQFINPSELNPAIDEEITFSMSYENLGETYLNGFNAKVEVDGVELESLTVDGLIQNDDNTVAISTPWSSDVQGIHLVTWTLDPLEEVGESDETNNTATRLVLVGNAPNPTITAFTVDNAGPDINDEINFQVIVDNEGDEDADMTLKLYYYDGAGVLTEFYSAVHTAAADVDLTIDIPWIVLESSTEILAEISAVDPQEYNEEDNTATLLLNGYDVDITITHLTCTGADDGELTAVQTGGVAPFSYLWNTGATTATISNLKAGEYSVEVTDDLGVVVNEVATVVVLDTEAPVVICEDLTLMLNELGTVSLQSSDVSYTDNCDDLLPVDFSQASFGCEHKGENVVTVSVTDLSGNAGECTMTVTVVDQILPTITCPDPITVNNDEDECFATIVDLGPYTAADNCPDHTVSNDAPETFPVGETTVTWIVTDASGNEAECTQLVTVVDNQIPMITCPDNVIVSVDIDACTAGEVDLGTPITDDNCDGETASNDAPEIFPLGETTVTWTVEDAAGLTETCTQLVTVIDDQFPTITCPADVEVSVDDDSCIASNVELGDATGSDNCDDYTITNDAPVIFETGITTVTWTIEDGSGNETTCEQIVTVIEDVDPLITCPPAMEFSADEADCFATVSDIGLPNGFDNCGVFEITNDAPETFPVGETTVIWTITDAAGNDAECTQVITVVDDEVPTITCPDALMVSVDIDACTASEVDLGTPITDDNCEVEIVSNNAPVIFPIGTTEVIWTVEDAAGLTATCVQLVTVIDDQFPTITCPSDIEVSVDEDACTASDVELGGAIGEDNCEGFGITNDAPSIYETGMTTVTWTITDAAGNETTCEQIVTVVEDIDPIITCPPAMTFSVDEDQCFATIEDLGTANGFDNCGSFTIENDAPATFPVGETTVIWTIIDAAGNDANCTQLITVTDDQLPSITCPDAIAVSADENLCSAIIDLGNPTYSDNCPDVLISNDAPETFSVGETTVTWIATDAAGNESSCTQLVTVTDSQLPIINCPTAVTVTAQPNLCSASEVFLGDPTVIENCEGYTISNDAPFTYPIGETVVTWTVIDAAGLEHTCEQIVTVIDNEAPEITCVSDIPITLAISLTATEYIVSGDELDAIATDNCNVSITNDYNGSSTLADESFTVGDHTVVWTASDSYGNQVTCSIMITVENSSCAPTFSLSDHSDNCPIEEFFVAVDVSDVGLGDAVDITNDGGAPAILNVTEGIHIVGPFSAAAEVHITVEDIDDVTCFDSKSWMITDACPDPLDYFKMTIVTHDPDEIITIPTIGSGYDYQVKWGDGITTNDNAGDAVHTYSTPGTYQIQILGDFPRIYFNNEGNRQKIQSIDQWGSIQWQSMERAFYGCYAMDVIADDIPDLSMVTNMSEMFRGAAFSNLEISDWDVSNVTDMSDLFRGATEFNTNINDWDVSSVMRMNRMFFDAEAYNQPMNNWDVSNVTTLESIFRNSAFDQDINGWDVSKVTNMSKTFSGTPFDHSLSDWDVSSVTNMREMFYNNISFGQDINDWDVSNVQDMSEMFAATNYNQNLSEWEVSSVTDMNGMFDGNGQFNQDITAWDVGQVTDMKDMFAGALSFDQDLSTWDMTSVTDAKDMFDGVTLSTHHYDNMLIYWSEQVLQSGVVFSGGNSLYCNGAGSRETIVMDDSWIITDGGYDDTACELCTFVVANTDDAGEGSLRSAITCADNFPGADTITFDIPGIGPHTIDLMSQLVMIDDSTVIDATTQLDNYPMDGQVVVDMTLLPGANTTAIRVIGEASEIYGIDFKNYDTSGKQSALYYAFGSDDFILGDSMRGNWFTGDRYHTAVFTKENINGGTIQSNRFETENDTIETAILINSGTNHILIGGQDSIQGNEFINCDYAAIELRNYSNGNTVTNNYFKENTRAIFNNGDFLNGFNEGNEFWDNTYICNDTAIVNTDNSNLGILPPVIEYSKINFVSGTASPGTIVEIYASADTCSSVDVVCAGEILIGRDSVDVDGSFHVLLSSEDLIPLGYSVTATQTDTLVAGTSEFTDCAAVDAKCVDFVYTCNDNTVGSLRSAIDCAADGETIYFLNYLMGDMLDITDGICIDKDLTIEGLGNPGLTLLSNAVDYIFKVNAEKSVTIKELILCTNDTAAPHIINNLGNLTLDNVTINDKRTGVDQNVIINNSGATLELQNVVELLME